MPVRLLQILGEVPHTEAGIQTNEFSKMYDKSKWIWLLDAPFKISNQCCNVMKKSPMHHYQTETGRNPFVGTMAEESRLRKSQWIKFGCNMFDAKYPISKPLSFWTEQDILQYIKKYNLEIAEAYGEIRVKTKGEVEGQVTIQEVLQDYRECELETTKETRTGCIFCMFGIMSDKERFKRLAQEEPKLCDFVMRGGAFNGENWEPNNEGLGYWFVIEWLNINGNCGIYIPDRERYIKEYSTPETRKILKLPQAADVR